MATEAPKRPGLDDGKYDVTSLTDQNAGLPALNERRSNNAQLDLRSVFRNAFRINSQFLENGTLKTVNTPRYNFDIKQINKDCEKSRGKKTLT